MTRIECLQPAASRSAQCKAPCHAPRRAPVTLSPCTGRGGLCKAQIPWLRCPQPCCGAFLFLKGPDIPPPATQAAPHTQPVLSNWKPARAHLIFICFSHPASDLVTIRCISDFPLQASIWQLMPVNATEQTGMRGVFSQAEAGTAQGLARYKPQPPI